jgi:hypothetical protein
MSCRNEFSTASSQCWRLLIVGIVTSVVIHAVVFHASPCMAADAPAKKSVHPLVRALKYARSSLKTVEAASDYSAEFVKRDIVNGQVHAHTTLLKYRAKPMSAYLKFKVPHAGREVIYVQGKNDGKLLAHETGLASLIGTISLLPTSTRAMSESKHPITEIGMAKLVIGLIDQWEAESKFGEIEVKYFPQATHTKLGKQKHLVIQAVHPQRRRQFNFHQSRLWIDRKTNLPVRVAHWGFPARPDDKPPLLEEYTYRNVKLNVGLKDIDFDVKNPKYAY